MTPLTTPRLAAVAAAATLALAGCQPRAAAEGADSSAMAAPPPTPVAATPPAASDTSWRVLFDGTSAAAWRGYRSASLPAGWRVEGGELRRVGEGGDIVTRDQFGDFELELEWKVARGGNSGVMYRVVEGGDSSETYMSGPEMQVLDDAGHPNGKVALTAAGALYGLYPAPKGPRVPRGSGTGRASSRAGATSSTG